MIKQERKIGFALALIEIAKEENKVKEIYQQSKIIIKTLEENQNFIDVLDDSNIIFANKEIIITKTYGKFHWSLLNTIMLLSKQCNFKYILDILFDVIKELSKILNIKEGIVYSVSPLSSNKLKELENKLTKKLKTQIVLKNYLDKELIAGFKIIIDDVVIESSIKADLENLKDTLIKNRGL